MTREEIQLRVVEIHENYNFRCQYSGCNSRSEHIAHRIAHTKSNKSEIRERLRHLNLDGKISVNEIIHHEMNLIPTCGKHNDYANIGFKPIIKARLLTKIIKDLTQ